MRMYKSLVYLGLLFVILSCSNNRKSSIYSFNSFYQLKAKNFDTVINQKQVKLYQLKNSFLEAIFTNYGGRLVSLIVPDKKSTFTDVVVGLPSVNDYINSTEPYFGATIGRFGNRIANGKFSIDDKPYSLFTNNGPNTLHGGKVGFQYVVWDAVKTNDSTIVFKYFSKDGEEGFPGNMNVEVTYALRNHAIQMKYEAISDKKTVINLTNHAFFNLNGEGKGSILNHKLQIFSDDYTPVDSTLIPTGKIETVLNTPFDFRKLTAIGARINDENQQLLFGGGYDHNFVLNKTKGFGMYHAAKIMGDISGIVMDIYTQEPGLQFYSGNFMKGKNTFKNGSKDEYRTAFALETQHFPDSPNQSNFPSTLYYPNQKYTTTSWYVFSVQK